MPKRFKPPFNIAGLGHFPQVRATLAQMDRYQSGRFVAAIRRLGPEFCPNCLIDLMTNPGVEVTVDFLVDKVTLRCDCRKGAYALTQEKLEDLYQLI